MNENLQETTCYDGACAPSPFILSAASDCVPPKITFKSSPLVTYVNKRTTPSNSTNAESTCIDSEGFQIKVKPATRFFDGKTECLIPAYSTHSKNRGHVLIINNINYKNDDHPKRKGAEIDGRSLQELFEQMGLIVKIYIDLKSTEMREAIVNFRSNSQLEDTDMAFVILMGYGDHVNEGSRIIGTDNTCITTKWIEEQFNYANCKALHKKPKIFIYQASRGTLRDFGVASLMKENSAPRTVLKLSGNMLQTHLTLFDQQTEIDSPSGSNLEKLLEGVVLDAQATLIDQRTHMKSVPRTVLREREDMLIAYSTMPGYASHRDIGEGSWYIQTFCEVMMNYAHVHHLEEIFKIVDFQLATRQSAEGSMQTSMLTSFGFNNHCYMHPKIYMKDGEIRNTHDNSVIL